MPSPLWNLEADNFSKLVSQLSSEHARVVHERDQLRRICARSGVDMSAARESRVVDIFSACTYSSSQEVKELSVPPPLEGCVFPSQEPNYLAPVVAPTTSGGDDRKRKGAMASTNFGEQLRPKALDFDPSLDFTQEEDSEKPQTPRQLRVFRGDATIPADDTSEMGKTARHVEGEKLELHARWLDLYVANQVKVDVLGNATARKSCSDLGQLLGQPTCADSNERLTSHREGVWLVRVLHAKVPLTPHSKFRVLWDTFGVPIIMYDMFMIPMQLAWDMSPNHDMIRVMLLYWVADIVVNFNTAFGSNGHLVLERREVIKDYMRFRFWLDIFLVTLDLVTLASPANIGDVGWYRAFRAFRVLRILRAFKLSRMQETLEEMFMDSGIEKMLLFFAISQTIIAIFLLAHILSCGWYFLGRTEVNNGSESWLNLVPDFDPVSEDVLSSYIHSMYWTLGNVVGGNVSPILRPMTLAEEIYTVSMISLSLLVVGAGISKMTNTIADLERVNMEAKDTRRKLSQVLRASSADADLSSRILRFGMHLFSRRSSLNIEDSVMGLLSQALASELTLSQRSRYLVEHPLLEHIKDKFSDVYLQLCGAFSTSIYADSDAIFMEGTVADRLYLTIRGNYVLKTSLPNLQRLPEGYRSITAGAMGAAESLGALPKSSCAIKFSGLRWLCEIALYTTIVHKNTLRTTSFADAFTLTGEAFASCVAKSPRCISEVYHYATQLLAHLEDIALKFCEQFVEEGDPIDYEVIPKEISRRITDAMDDHKVDNDVQYQLDSPVTDDVTVEKLISDIMSGEVSGPDELVDELSEVFGELNVPEGIYHGLKMEPERKRSLCAMVSVIWLIQDNYESFTAIQANPRNRLSKELWADMQRFVRWAGITRDELRAMLVFLAIRGIGKAAPFLQAMQRECRTAEDVVVTLMEQLPRKVPSYNALKIEERTLLQKAFNIHRGFNFAQMLQGENAPYHIGVLQRMVKIEGIKVFKFYLFSLVGVMCGLRGAENPKGSLFMDQGNGSTLMAGIRMLERLDIATANGIYWGYIREKAHMLNLSFNQLEDLALARLACLTRAKQSDIGALQVEWYRLNRGDREAFMKHFICDGLYKATYVFTFLPAYLANARANRNVGMYRAMVVLVELIDTLTGDGYLDKGARVVTVSLQDLAEFTAKVESPGVFMAVHVHSNIVARRNHLEFIVSAKHKQHTTHQNWSDDPTHEMRALMRRMNRRVHVVNRELERLASPKMSPVTDDSSVCSP